MNKKILTLLAAGAFCASSLALARDEGFYAAVNVGQSDFGDCVGFSNCDATDVGFKIIGGYRFNKHLAIEASYVDLGETTVRVGNVGASIVATGFAAQFVGTLPIADRFSMFAKVGLIYGELKGSIGSLSAKERDTDFAAGLGLKYDFTPNLSAKLEWDRYRFKVEREKGDVDLYSVGLALKF